MGIFLIDGWIFWMDELMFLVGWMDGCFDPCTEAVSVPGENVSKKRKI